MLRVVVTSADISDPAGAHWLLSYLGAPVKSCVASGSGTPWMPTYRGQLLDWVQQRFKFCLHPVLRSDDQKGFVLLPKRWIVERTFGWLNVCRRLSKEYEELVYEPNRADKR